MENNPLILAKKVWQKPHFYLLDSNTVKGGGGRTDFYEANNLTRNVLVNASKHYTFVPSSQFDNYAHS